MNKGGKFIFGKSLLREDLTINLPKQAISEYDITSEGKVYLISGSKTTGGFVVTRKGWLYCWVHISENGTIKLTHKILETLDISIGIELLSIRSSDIAFVMGVKGPLLEKAHNFKGTLEVY